MFKLHKTAMQLVEMYKGNETRKWEPLINTKCHIAVNHAGLGMKSTL